MRLQFAAAALLLALACKSEPPKVPQLSETIPNLPFPPQAEVVASSGGEDALQIRFRTVAPVQEVADYYRDFFSKGGWHLVSDTKTADGAVAMYAEGSGPPLWVTIRKQPDADATLVDLVGAKLPKKP